jgi:hypothetical protein
MDKRILTISLGLLAALCSALTGIACAYGAPQPQPNPPPQICVNNKCATTTQDPPPVNGTQQIKWNPGHYMASYNVVYGGQKSISNLQYEMDDLNNRDAMLGYRMFITWGALEPTQGNYDFSLVDAVLARLKTAYNKPKRLVVELWLYSHGAYSSGDGSVFPQYIQTNPMYGASPVSGSFGWWGKNAGGASTGLYAPALYNAPVMDRLIALTQALGKHLDGEPYLEAFFIQEDSTIAQAAANLGSVDPNYSDAGWLAQLQRLMTASTGAFPHTNVILANSYFLRPASGIAMEQWMAANRIAAGAADTLGQSAITTYGTGIIGDGLQTYLGVAQFGGTDLRPTMAAMMDIQGPDLYTTYFAKHGGPYTPLDIINAMNQTYKATHAFWTRLTGPQVPAAAQWSALAATAAANPLIRTAYPQNYQ